MKKSKPEKQTCSGTIRKKSHFFRVGGDNWDPCPKTATTACPDDGRPYCKACNPSLRREREEARRKKSIDRWARLGREQALQDAVTKADAAIVKAALARHHARNDGSSVLTMDRAIVQKAASAREALSAFNATKPKPKVHQ